MINCGRDTTKIRSGRCRTRSNPWLGAYARPQSNAYPHPQRRALTSGKKNSSMPTNKHRCIGWAQNTDRAC